MLNSTTVPADPWMSTLPLRSTFAATSKIGSSTDSGEMEKQCVPLIDVGEVDHQL